MDKDALEKMYHAYFMRVYSYVMTLSANPDLAEEITQETFYRALASDKSSFRGKSDEVTWLCAIAHNLFIDETRRWSKNHEIPEDVVSESDIEKSVLDKEMSFKIHCILHSLEEPYKEVFELRIFGELSFAEIGKIFAKSENWARVTYHRSKLKIQERMGKNE